MEAERILEKFYRERFGLKFINISRFLGVYLLTIERINERLAQKIESEKFDRQIPKVNIPWDISEFLVSAGTIESWNHNILSRNIDFTTETERETSNRFCYVGIKFFVFWPFLLVDVVKVNRIFMTYILRGSLPIKSSLFSCIDKAFIPNLGERRSLYNYLLKGGIEKKKSLLISRSIPMVYLEGFEYYYTIYGNKRRKLVTSYAHFSNHIFHYLSAFNESTSIIVYEHGTESLNKWNDYFDFELGIATRLYGLSRVLNETNRYRWFRLLKFSKQRTVKSKNTLMVTVNMPKFALDDRSMPNAYDFDSYMHSVHELGKFLASKTTLTHRPYFDDSGWSEIDLLKFGQWPKDTRSMKLLLDDYGIFVITYPGSLWFELLKKGKVVILVWNYINYPLRDQLLEDELIKENILFLDSNALAIKLDSILSDLQNYRHKSMSVIKNYFEK